MTPLRKSGIGVFVAEAPITCWGIAELTLVKEEALRVPLRRARICAHQQVEDPLHEMLIALCAGTYIAPHKHIDKSESFHVLEGKADICIFDDNGNLTQVIPLGQNVSCGRFYYRLSTSFYHTIIVRSAMFVVHETTNGPFDPSQTQKACFAPLGDGPAAEAYLGQLNVMCASFMRKNVENQI